ncbi:MAG: hypothetical protein FJ303_27105 [Planctomycetes bacterium]|nr:hypothetical protein [Planctomycetota bacterium]
MTLTLCGAGFGSDPERPAEATKVHLVVLGYTPNDNFGKACRDDIEAMKETLGAALKDRLTIHELSDKNPKTGKFWTKDEVMNYLQAMQIGPNESIVLYHSGHGRIADARLPERTHRWQINSGEEVSRGAMTDILRCRHPRALIVLSDCCSAIVADRQGACEGTDDSGADLNVDTVRNLFLRANGVISITAAEDGTCGIIGYRGTNPAAAGSSFTVAMLRLCYVNQVYADWNAFFPDLRTETFRTSGEAHQARAFHLPKSK